jgi:enoyl-CoA hydratase/carnithine racemase
LGDSYQFLLVKFEQDAVIISLLSHVLKVHVLAELRDVIQSTHSHRIVITGANGYFAAGADIGELTALDGPHALDYARFGQQVLNDIGESSAVTIAAIDGYCMGGGLDLALACDLRYATSQSIFAHPGGRIGIMTGWGGTRRLPLTIGKSRALEMMVGGRRITAAEAADWGLIGQVVDDPVKHALMLPI